VNTDYWEYNGKNPKLENLGIMPAFESFPDGGEVVYTGFYHVYILGYIVSALASVLILCYYFWESYKEWYEAKGEATK